MRPEWNVDAVRPEMPHGRGWPQLVTADLVESGRPTRHDPAKLAGAVMGLLRDRKKGREAA
jgi:hypothetical protein